MDNVLLKVMKFPQIELLNQFLEKIRASNRLPLHYTLTVDRIVLMTGRCILIEMNDLAQGRSVSTVLEGANLNSWGGGAK